MTKAWLRKGSLSIAAIIMAFSLAACGANNGNQEATNGAGGTNGETPAEEPAANVTGEIKLEGSSTVYPISQAIAEEFMNLHDGVNVTVGLSGSSNGFKAIINGEADIADASRKIKDKEIASLQEKNQEAVEMPVAYDGITVVVNPQNDWANDITVEELHKIWAKDSKVTKWSEVREGWPDEKITLFGPGAASGTFEYFTEAVNGEAKVSREDFTASEDDNVLVQGVAGDKYALGYFGFAYYEENQDKLKAVAIKETADAPAVMPSVETIGDASYKPLSREIYIYPLKSAMERPEVQEFIKFYMSAEGQQFVEEVGYVALPQEKYDANLSLLPQ
ncbi:PstS family phosphate ABC transporter substrate-binding protein [Paenibacillus thermotolerans]|uniref:PstS family phosphate ABC transporter substrate-binding protein n=1 Tax=Paenibacillus thermotolerans TaxID=3027807 RepID=UPI0023682039|nr:MULTISPECIES: PstS family phosphate ABC transporter substrate-binding protein [unclassified Paenibacillus]